MPILSSQDDAVSASQRILLRATAGNVDLVLSDLKSLHRMNSSDGEKLLAEYEKESGRIVLAASSEQENLSSLMNHVERRLNEYLKKNYADQAAARAMKDKTIQTSIGTDSFDIVVYAEKVDLKNCYSGSWSGKFHVEYAKRITFSGAVKVSTHVFEGDNVQMSSELHFSPQILEQLPSDDDVSMTIARHIQSLDSQILSSMDSLYDNASGGLKSLRKSIPVTRTKFDWNLNSQRFRKTLSHSFPIK